MSYSRGEDVCLGTGCLASLQPSNLSAIRCGLNNIVCYVSLSDVVVAEIPATSGRPSTSTPPTVISGSSNTIVTSCNLIDLAEKDSHDHKDNTALLLLGSFGARLISLKSEDSIWNCSVETLTGYDELENKSRAQEIFAHGYSICLKDRSILAIGLSNGYICLLYRRSGELVRRLLGGHHNNLRSALVALDASATSLVSINESNEITVFNTEDDFVKLREIPVSAAAQDLNTTLCLKGDNILVGYVSGSIRVFSLEIGHILFEIAGHGRCVTGLSAHPSKMEVSSCGEDQCINVWTLPENLTSSSTASVELVYHDLVENTLLTGVQWTGEGRLYAVGYDSDIIRSVMPYAVRKM